MDLSKPITRRAAIRDMGKAGLAIVIFGTACTETGGSSTLTTVTSLTSTTRSPASSTTTEEQASSTTSSPVAVASWARVDMGFVSAYILYRNGEAALVDTGQSGAEADIEAGLGSVGLGWDTVTSVIVTHKHPDHAGSVGAVAGLAVNANIYAGAGDLDAIGPVTSGEGVQGPVAVGDDDSVFGLDIIETPGHTPGHICVLDPIAGILVAGDAMNRRDGALRSASADPNFTEDLAMADASVRKLAGFDYEVVLVGHGEPIEAGGASEVADLAASLP